MKILRVLLILVGAVVAFGFYRTMIEPSDLWAGSGSFPSCPTRPSCVSSMASDPVHKVDPIRYEGESAQAKERLERAVRAMPNTTILRSTPEYLHVLYLTPRMRFHDDVELLVAPAGVIQVRSISRFGYGDHGVNRARVESIREEFAKVSASPQSS
jgi:uncharacterized protein (DUF1499 family)